MKSLYYGSILFIVGLICGEYNATPKDYLFLKEANAFKYELLEYADDYIINSQKLFEKMECDEQYSFADTWGESYEYDHLIIAFEKYDSLLTTQL